ncbi:MAG: Ig-like domain repeat protein [Marmoricola sp.]|nr:Ig-like domain repeat protein [Marmoricola sp.]
MEGQTRQKVVIRMSLRFQRRSLLGVVLVVVAALGLVAVPAQAADPIPTTTTLVITGGDHIGDPVTMTATATSASGTPTGTFYLTGTHETQAFPADANGSATYTDTMRQKSVEFQAYFVGTNGYGDSHQITQKVTLDLVYFDAQPTVARIGAGGLRLTLSFAVHLHDVNGAPMAGRAVEFTLFHPPTYSPGQSTGPVKVVCDTVSDAHGNAACSGNEAPAAIVSILSGGAWASHMVPDPFFGTSADEFTKLPVIVLG